MVQVPITSLDPALQKHVENARLALDRGRLEEAMELCAIVLAAEPDCLHVRKIERAAQLKFAAIRRGWVAKLVSAVSTAPFLISGNLKLKDDPRSSLATAERLLRADPHSVSALSLLGHSARELGWTETAVFAFEAASDLEPDRPDLLVALGKAYLSAGRAAEAAGAANQVLLQQPQHVEAQTLLQHARLGTSRADGQSERRKV